MCKRNSGINHLLLGYKRKEKVLYIFFIYIEKYIYFVVVAEMKHMAQTDNGQYEWMKYRFIYV